jgi:hypothetical protein
MRLAIHHFYPRRQAWLADSDPFDEKEEQQRKPVVSMCHAEHRYTTTSS